MLQYLYKANSNDKTLYDSIKEQKQGEFCHLVNNIIECMNNTTESLNDFIKYYCYTVLFSNFIEQVNNINELDEDEVIKTKKKEAELYYMLNKITMLFFKINYLILFKNSTQTNFDHIYSSKLDSADTINTIEYIKLKSKIFAVLYYDT